MAAGFALHPRLAADCATVGDLPLSRLLVMNDRRFPWCILVPRIAGLDGLHELPAPRRAALLEEVTDVSKLLLAEPQITRINVGALGNVVEQLHVHVVGRHPADAAWPGPVWGAGAAEPYPGGEIEALCRRLRVGLDLD